MEDENPGYEKMAMINLSKTTYAKVFKTKDGWIVRFCHDPKNHHHVTMSNEGMDDFIGAIIGMKKCQKRREQMFVYTIMDLLKIFGWGFSLGAGVTALCVLIVMHYRGKNEAEK